MPCTPTPDIFKAYDIRGLYGEQIDGPIAEQIGRAFAHVLSDLSGKPVTELRVGLGRDMRLTAPELSERYRAGLLGEGAIALSGDSGIQDIRRMIESGLSESSSEGSLEQVDLYGEFHAT